VRVGAQVVVCCRNADCLHRAPMALTPLMGHLRFQRSSTRCAARHAGVRVPTSDGGSSMGWAPYPAQRRGVRIRAYWPPKCTPAIGVTTD
jgi:hypothetical protein